MIKDVLKRQTTIIAVTVIGICLCLMGVSYAIFFDIDKGNAQTVKSGTLTVQFAETKNGFITNSSSLEEPATAEPMEDSEGETSDGYQFSVTNTGTLPMKYNIYLYDDPSIDSSVGERLDKQYIKVKLDDGDITTLDSLTCEDKSAKDLGESGDSNISICKLNAYELGVKAKGNEGATKAHVVRIWISSDVQESEVDKIVALKLVVLGEAGEAKEPPKPPKAFTDNPFYATMVANTSQTANDDPDGNLRYIGPSEEVNNYIWFNCDDYDFTSAEEAATKNCEKWRIIGLFKNIKRVDGEIDNLVKIIRADSIGNIAWDTTGGTYGSNNWARPADLQTSLNETYYNGTDLSNGKGIKDSTRPMIEQVTWNIGGHTIAAATAQQFYTAERGSTVPSGAQATWDGYIGLMYPSDYGYATTGSNSGKDRAACLTTTLYDYDRGCIDKDWLYILDNDQWTLASLTSSTNFVFVVRNIAQVAGYYASNTVAVVRPSLYLKSSVLIANGEGTSTEPYIPKMA